MKKEPKRKEPSKKKARSEQKKEKTPKTEGTKWQDFLHRHSKVEEKK